MDASCLSDTAGEARTQHGLMSHKLSPHVSVCVCTYKRSEWLRLLLNELVGQSTADVFGYSLVLVDNDAGGSAREVVTEFQRQTDLEISYLIEPEQNIAKARNKALANATGEYIAFIDDDEVPSKDWLLKLFQTRHDYKSDGVLGPVIPLFEEEPPQWVIKGRFNDRPTHQTGFVIPWLEGRTGNLLFRRDILLGMNPIFLPEFGSGGEDRNFFYRLSKFGYRFVWCDEAPVYERVPATRWKRSFMVRRALLRGKMALLHRRHPADLAKSFLALTVYALALPFFLIIEHSLFMKYLIKACDHAGKLLAFANLNPVREKYVTK